MDIFCEYMVAHKKGAKEILIGAGIVFLATFLTMLLLMFWQFIYQIGFLLVVGVWYCAVRFIRKTDIEYEYILTNEILDIDKIMSKSSRKRMISLNLKEISGFEKADKVVDKESLKLDFSGDIKAHNVYCIDTQKDGKKVRIFFQPSAKMLEGMHKVVPNLVPDFEAEL